MRFNRFVFLNLPMLSLETHLGVTASPQAPFPADYVTLPVSGKSPPLRLTPSRSRGRACSLLQHQLRRDMHSRHAQATRPPFGRASLSGRTVRKIGNPFLVGGRGDERAIQQIWRNDVFQPLPHIVRLAPTLGASPQCRALHQSFHPVQPTGQTPLLEVVPHPPGAVSTIAVDKAGANLPRHLGVRL